MPASVAKRRDFGNRLSATALERAAKRAKAAMRLPGIAPSGGNVMPWLLILSSRSRARTSEGLLTYDGPVLNWSDNDLRFPSGTDSKASSLRCPSWSIP